MDSISSSAVSLGDLADLTVTNDNELSCDVSHPPMSPWCPQTCPKCPLGSAVPVVSPNVALSIPWALLSPSMSPNPHDHPPWTTPVPITSL